MENKESLQPYETDGIPGNKSFFYRAASLSKPSSETLLL